MRILLLILCFSSFSLAQTLAFNQIALVPLDSRPVNSSLPKAIAAIGNLEMLTGLQTQLFGFRLGATRFKVVDAYFPWLRSFEICFDLESRSASSACQPVCVFP